MKEIILFNADYRQDSLLREICVENAIGLRIISMEDLDQKVGYLAGLAGFDREDKKSDFESKYDFCFLLFKDFSNEEIFAFIDQMKKKDLYIAHKAALTEQNIKWPLRFLLDENDQEHKTIELVQEINSLVKIAHDHKEAHGENPEIKNQVQKINAYFQDPESFELKEARKLKEELEAMVKKLN
ncbi:MAG: DUF3783 domain-containing protein [Peptoniphilaceae bacterium]|nr:DUF3783 domain-containing protein [Peptoniphilaceae bacterium]MDY6019653.1 DUF3783 domain-containing protein [Anaerococcus sp.]